MVVCVFSVLNRIVYCYSRLCCVGILLWIGWFYYCVLVVSFFFLLCVVVFDWKFYRYINLTN